MSKSELLREINARIDRLILAGDLKSAEHLRLVALHLSVLHAEPSSDDK